MDQDSSGPRKNETVVLVGLLVVSAALRIWALIEASHLPSFTHHRLDPAYYHEFGLSIANGDWQFGSEVFHLSPLYSFLVGGVYTIFGDGPWPIRVIQLVLGVFTVFLIHRAARSLLGVRAALLAGLIAALYGPFVFYEEQISAAVLATFLHAALLVIMIRLAASRKPGLALSAVTGLLWGLCILTRPNALALVIPILLALKGDRLPQSSPSRHCSGWLDRRFLAAGLVAVSVAAIAVAPATLNNHAAAGEFLLVTDSGGMNFYLGNGEGAIGTYRLLDELPTATSAGEMFRQYQRYAEETMGRPLSPGEVAAFWTRRAMKEIAEDPGRWSKLLVEKAWLFFNRRELPSSADYSFTRLINPALGLPLVQYGWLAPLALVGTALMLRRSARHRVVSWTVLSYLAALTVIFVLAHYRLPAIPAIILAAVAAVTQIGQWVKEQRFLYLALTVPALALAVFIAWTPKLGTSFADEYFKLGYAYHVQEQLEQAQQAYLEALTEEPDHLSALNNLAHLLQSTGEREQAARVWIRLMEAARNRGEARYELEARENLRILGVENP